MSGCLVFPLSSVERSAAKPPVQLIYLDTNNLYGKAKLDPLPTSSFNRLSEGEIRELDNLRLRDNAERRYIFEVDLKVPKYLHDLHKDYPSAPKR